MIGERIRSIGGGGGKPVESAHLNFGNWKIGKCKGTHLQEAGVGLAELVQVAHTETDGHRIMVGEREKPPGLAWTRRLATRR